MSRSDLQIDLKAINFPTETLTIKELRLRLASQGAGGVGTRTAARLGEGLMVSVNSETKLAQWAFDEALGREVLEQHPGERDEIRETLAVEYADYLHIAAGEHHAQQLIRDLETAAAEQARRLLKGK